MVVHTSAHDKSYVFFHSGGVKKERGVAFVVERGFADLVDFRPVNDRLAVAEISGGQAMVSVIGVYAPTECSSDDAKDTFYKDLTALLSNIPKKHLVLVCGDFNAECGASRAGWERVMGPHGIGHLNDNGLRMLTMASYANLKIGNTFFEHSTKQKITWHSNTGRCQKQLDYILVGSNFGSTLLDVKANCEATIGSDHSLVIGKLRMKLRAPKKHNRVVKRDLSYLLRPEHADEFKIALQNRFTPLDEETVESCWAQLKDALTTAVAEVCPRSRRKTHEWISTETMALVDERKEAAHRGDHPRRNFLNREIKRHLDQDEEHWRDQKCEKLESASVRGDMRTVYQTLNELTKGKPTAATTSKVKNTSGEVIKDPVQRRQRWAEHFETLLNRPDPTELDHTLLNAPPVDVDNSVSLETPSVEEVRAAIAKLKVRKAAGLDDVYAEALRAGGDTVVERLHALIRQVWDTENVPEDWKDGMIIPLHKKGDRSLCSNYRGITLLSIAGKVLTSIIQGRILENLEAHTDEAQAGFRPHRGCTDQIFCLRQVQERRIKYGKGLITVFIDFSAAFDSIHRESLWKALAVQGLPVKIINILRSLYDGAKSYVRVDGQLSDPFMVSTGVRQGCVISPKLFNVIINWIASRALSQGVRVGQDYWIRYLAYADDMAIFAESEAEAQAALDQFDRAASRLGLVINVQKTKVMGSDNIKLRGAVIERVDDFTYLGSKITHDTISPSDDIATRIAKATVTFARLRNGLWSRRQISIKTKMRIYRAGVLSVLLYGAETWRTTDAEIRQLEVFHMRNLREISGVSLWERRRNETIRANCDNQPTIKQLMKKSRLRWFGHMSRMDPSRDPRRLTVEPVPQGWKRARNAPKRLWIDQVQTDLQHLKEVYGAANWSRGWLRIAMDQAENRNQWRLTVGSAEESGTRQPTAVRRR
jgi:hypothetical protein